MEPNNSKYRLVLFGMGAAIPEVYELDKYETAKHCFSNLLTESATARPTSSNSARMLHGTSSTAGLRGWPAARGGTRIAAPSGAAA